jgi:ComF family protein
MRIFNDILNIFFPNVCLSCDSVLTQHENTLCSRCLADLPLTNYLKNENINVVKVFYGRIKIEHATALLFYHKKGITQELIHKLKYKGYEQIGTFFGDWLGIDLKKEGIFEDIDYIIPVPLHKNRLKSRGYNQVTKFGQRLAFHLDKPFIEDKLIRTNANKTQTKKSRLERIKNVNELFYLTDNLFFEGKHILLIDDIITTGATIEACANELLKTKNIKISLAVMAITE